MQTLASHLTVSLTDFKKNPAKVLREAGTHPVAVLSHNKPAFYVIDPVLFEALLEEVADAQVLPRLKRRISSAERGNFVEVDIDTV